MAKKKDKHADGIYHARITIAFIPIAALVAGAAFFVPVEWWLRAVLGAVGCLLGLVIGPDLDQDLTNFNRQIWFKIPVIGWCLGYLYSWFWHVYAKMFAHRGVSHSIPRNSNQTCLYCYLDANSVWNFTIFFLHRCLSFWWNNYERFANGCYRIFIVFCCNLFLAFVFSLCWIVRIRCWAYSKRLLEAEDIERA